MTDLTKLADALELKGQSWQELKDREEACREAARILRAAGAADVGGLMAMSDTSIVLACDYLMTHKESAKQKAVEHRAALELALRVALAQRDGYVIDLLVAAGHVTAEKVAQAREIAAAQAGAQEPKP